MVELQAKVVVVDFLGGPVVKTLPANAGDVGLPLVQEDSTYCRATNLRSTTTEPTCPIACAPQQEKPQQRLACALQREISPRSTELEKAHTQQ